MGGTGGVVHFVHFVPFQKGAKLLQQSTTENDHKMARQIRQQVWEGGSVDGTAESAHPDESGRI